MGKIKNLGKLLRTGLVCLTFIGFAMSSALTGASLLDLQIKIQESFSRMSQVIVVRSFGYMAGNFMCK